MRAQREGGTQRFCSCSCYRFSIWLWARRVMIASFNFLTCNSFLLGTVNVLTCSVNSQNPPQWALLSYFSDQLVVKRQNYFLTVNLTRMSWPPNKKKSSWVTERHKGTCRCLFWSYSGGKWVCLKERQAFAMTRGSYPTKIESKCFQNQQHHSPRNEWLLLVFCLILLLASSFAL